MSERTRYRPYSLQVEVPWDLHAVLSWDNGNPSRLSATGVWVIISTLDGFVPTLGSLCLIQPSSNPRAPQYVRIDPGMRIGSHPAPNRLGTGEE